MAICDVETYSRNKVCFLIHLFIHLICVIHFLSENIVQIMFAFVCLAVRPMREIGALHSESCIKKDLEQSKFFFLVSLKVARFSIFSFLGWLSILKTKVLLVIGKCPQKL